MLAAAGRAAERAAGAWRGEPAGRPLLEDAGRLDAASPDLAARTGDAVRDWQGEVLELVRAEGMGKRTTARLASLGVNGAGLTVMIAVFASTGGLTGAEVVVAGGTSALSQKVLEAIFGDQAVRTLAAQAREDLMARVRALLDEEAAPLRARARAGVAAARPGVRARRRRPRARAGAVRRGGGSLDARLAALAEAAELARGRLDDERVEAAEAVVARAGRRLGLGVEATVVALAGPTGAGKSTLFNALAGAELAPASHRRPTTSAPTAAVWGDVGDELLDWLEVARRHRLGGEPDGLVLLDLPDFDSVELSHRVEVERVIALADLMVWVVDPQKYADGVLHEHYLRPFAEYRDVMVVVLNQADRLDAAGRAACVADLGPAARGRRPRRAAGARRRRR